MEGNKLWNSHIIRGLTAYIPRYMVVIKGVIQDVPEDMELKNLMEQLNSDNHNKHAKPFQVTGAVRHKMKVKEKKEEADGDRWVWKESRAVCSTFRTKELPPYETFSEG
jgi:hypothetical protein